MPKYNVSFPFIDFPRSTSYGAYISQLVRFVRVSSHAFIYAFFLARYIAVVSILSICLVCDSNIVATCPSIPAARFAFRFCFIRFVLLLVVVLFGEPKQNQGRGLVNCKLVLSPTSRNFFPGCSKTAFLFWFLGDFRCGVL